MTNGLIIICGERGIRTPGTSRYGGFQDRCNRPLYHLSKSKTVPKDSIFWQKSGRRWIRTTEVERQQIYSLPHLAALETTHSRLGDHKVTTISRISKIIANIFASTPKATQKIMCFSEYKHKIIWTKTCNNVIYILHLRYEVSRSHII